MWQGGDTNREELTMKNVFFIGDGGMGVGGRGWWIGGGGRWNYSQVFDL